MSGVLSFPATVAQRSWWTLKGRCPDPAAWDPTWAVRLWGPLSEDALEAATADVVARHPGLRSTFALDQGRLQQRFAETPGPFRITREDLSDRPDPVAEARLLGAELARKGFERDGEERVRVHVFRLGADDHVVVLGADHLVMEAWTYQVVLGELRARYAAQLRGPAAPLAPPDRHLGDHALFELQQAASTGAAQRRFWRRELAGLGSAFPPREGASPSHAEALLLDGADARPLLGPDRAETPFVRGLSAVLRAAAPWLRAPEVAVGTLVVNRAHPGAHELVGVFVNVVVLRIELADVEDRERFRAHVASVARDALRRSTTPLDELLDATRLVGTPFDVFFQHVNARALVRLAAPEGAPQRAARMTSVEDVLPHRWGLAGLVDEPFALPRADAKAVIEAHLVSDEDRAALQLITDAAHLDASATRELAARLRAELTG